MSNNLSSPKAPDKSKNWGRPESLQSLLTLFNELDRQIVPRRHQAVSLHPTQGWESCLSANQPLMALSRETAELRSQLLSSEQSPKGNLVYFTWWIATLFGNVRGHKQFFQEWFEKCFNILPATGYFQCESPNDNILLIKRRLGVFFKSHFFQLSPCNCPDPNATDSLGVLPI